MTYSFVSIKHSLGWSLKVLETLKGEMYNIKTTIDLLDNRTVVIIKIDGSNL